MRRPLLALLAAALVFPQTIRLTSAHGYSGKRFFPATLATDDPFVADELSLPTVVTRKNAASDEKPITRGTSVGVDVAKRITPDLGIAIGDAWLRQKPLGQKGTNGRENIEGSIKYQLLNNPDREFLLAAGVDAEWGGSGAERVGAERFNVFTPSVFFGKGFGDLPDGWDKIRPFAVTGSLGVDIPSRGKSFKYGVDPDSGEVSVDRDRHGNVVRYRFALEYSVPYLQSFVEDIGLEAPFDRLIPLVEVDMQLPVNRSQRGGFRNTGTINPGVIWAGQHFQIGAEAIIPVNDASGRGIGGIAQLHFYLDDLFPDSIGKPIFSSRLFGG